MCLIRIRIKCGWGLESLIQNRLIKIFTSSIAAQKVSCCKKWWGTGTLPSVRFHFEKDSVWQTHAVCFIRATYKGQDHLISKYQQNLRASWYQIPGN